MSVRFVAASSQYLSRTFPVTYPFSLTWWAYAGSTAANTNLWAMYGAGGSVFIIDAAGGTNWRFYSGVASAIAASHAYTANAWYFFVLRAISVTNQRLSILEPDGRIFHSQHTADNTALPITTEVIGQNGDFASAWLDGGVAECSLAGADIQPDGGELNATLLRQLAYRGPFSVPRIKKDIVEYRSFRSGTHQPVAGEVYFGSKGIQAWTPTNGPTLGLHPPHAQPWNPQYVRPGGADYIVPVYVPDAIVPASGHRSRLLLMGVG